MRLQHAGFLALCVLLTVPECTKCCRSTEHRTLHSINARVAFFTISVGALVKVVRRIDDEFAGETRTRLLEQARETFQRQIKTLEHAERTLEALEKLRDNQAALVETLKRLTVRRPTGVTLH